MIACGIASIPQRVEGLKYVLNNLIPQVDFVFLVLNGYGHVPDFVNKYEHLFVTLGDNSLGDSAKFLYVDKVEGQFIAWDDDLMPSAWAVNALLVKQKYHDCAVSFHGKCYRYPVQSYYRDIAVNYRCLDDVDGDHEVDVIGTGCMCFDTTKMKLNINDFHRRNMADLWFSKRAKEQNIKLMVVEHDKDWLTYIPQKWTIYRDSEKNGDETKVVNQILSLK